MSEEKSPNHLINMAFLGVQRRAESVDRQTLVQTFVDIGALFAVLSSHDHQIIYGRRGTGKTHALLYVAEMAKQAKGIPVYVVLHPTNLDSQGLVF
jgi:Cdc6-like AAA superfamily ATPase